MTPSMIVPRGARHGRSRSGSLRRSSQTAIDGSAMAMR